MAKQPKTRTPSGASALSLNRRTKEWQRWLEQYNPLANLVFAKARSMLDSSLRGEFTEIQWLYHHIEEAFPTLSALVERRLAAIGEMDWGIKIASNANKFGRLADEQSAALRLAYERIDNLKEGIEHLAHAAFRGYSHVQKHVGPDGHVFHLEPLDQWNFVRDGCYGDWFWNPEARRTSARALGEQARINPADFLIRTVRRHINRIALPAFIRYGLGLKDWTGWIEIFGLPGGVVIMPPEIPADKKQEFMAAARQIAAGGSGSLPHGSNYITPGGHDNRVGAPFRDFLRFGQEDVVLAGTGGLLTMLTAPGSGTLAGNAHQNAFRSIARAEGQRISAVFQSQFDAEILGRDFPGQPRLAYFEICGNEPPDVGAVIEHATKLSSEGWRMSDGEISEKTGYTLQTHQPPRIN